MSGMGGEEKMKNSMRKATLFALFFKHPTEEFGRTSGEMPDIPTATLSMGSIPRGCAV